MYACHVGQVNVQNQYPHLPHAHMHVSMQTNMYAQTKKARLPSTQDGLHHLIDLVRACDPTKIHLVVQAIHSALQPHVSYTTEGKDWATCNAFRQHLLAQAAAGL